MAPFGIFIRSERDDPDFRSEFLRALKGLIPSSSISFIHKVCDGFTVHFENEDMVSNVLKARKLRIENEDYAVYAMTTTLIVHSAAAGCNERFENCLRKTMAKVGPIAEAKMIPFINEDPSVLSGDWKVVLKVPDIEDSIKGVLEKVIEVEKGCLKIKRKLSVLGGRYDVDFCCSFCGEVGHTLDGCPRIEPETSCSGEEESATMSSNNAAPDPPVLEITEELVAPYAHRSNPNALLQNIPPITRLSGEEVARQRAKRGHNTGFYQASEQHLEARRRKRLSKRSAHGVVCSGEVANCPVPSSSNEINYDVDENEKLGTFSRPEYAMSDEEITVIDEGCQQPTAMNNNVSSSNSVTATGSEKRLSNPSTDGNRDKFSSGGEDANRLEPSSSSERNYYLDDSGQYGSFSHPEYINPDQEISNTDEECRQKMSDNNSVSSSDTAAATGSKNHSSTGSADGNRSKFGSGGEDANSSAPSSSSEKNYYPDYNGPTETFSQPEYSRSDEEMIIIVECRQRIAAKKSVSSFNSATAPGSNCPDESGEVSTSSLAEEATSDLSSDDSDCTTLQPPSATQSKKKPTHNMLIIPDGIKNIIRKRETVLNLSQLEAFFNHVKKRVRPSEVAQYYTLNLNGLLDQLQNIKNDYYNTARAADVDERKFIKWFEQLLIRFDRTPTKKIKPYL